MVLSPFPLTGLTGSRRAAWSAWLSLAIVALVPGWAIIRTMIGFTTVGDRALTAGAPNIWSVVAELPWIGDMPLAGLAAASAIGAAAWTAALFAVRPPRDVTAAALLLALIVPALLPGMAPQDFTLAGCLSLVLVIGERSRDNLSIAGLVFLAFVLTLVDLASAGAVPMIAATVAIMRRFLVSPANDNGSPLYSVRPYSVRALGL